MIQKQAIITTSELKEIHISSKSDKDSIKVWVEIGDLKSDPISLLPHEIDAITKVLGQFCEDFDLLHSEVF